MRHTEYYQNVRHNTKFKLINTIIWYYKNGMSAHRYFANRHEEVIWLAKTNDYYFDLDAVREPYPEKDLKLALKDKRLNPENTMKGKNPTNVWQIGRLNGIVLDFFAGSGTVGRVCITERRHCLMCDSDLASKDYFNKHIELMKKLGQSVEYEEIKSVDQFFNIE